MTYTRHGHQIIGTDTLPVNQRPPVARCGGPRMCKQCAFDASAAQPDLGQPLERQEYPEPTRGATPMMKHKDCERSFPHEAHDFINVNDMGCLSKCGGDVPMRACSCLPHGSHNDPHPYVDPNCRVHGVGGQPLPTASDAPIAHRMVQADLDERLRIGIERYGQPLQAHNGRDSLQDAYEEALDLCVYLRNAIYERDNPR